MLLKSKSLFLQSSHDSSVSTSHCAQNILNVLLEFHPSKFASMCLMYIHLSEPQLIRGQLKSVVEVYFGGHCNVCFSSHLLDLLHFL